MSRKLMAPRLPDVGFVCEALVRKLYPVSRTVLWRLVRDGQFPEPIELGPNTTAWPVQKLRQHFAEISPLAVEAQEVLQ